MTLSLLNSIGVIVGIIVGVYAILDSRRTRKKNGAQDLAAAIMADPTFREAVASLAKTAVADRLQVLINDRTFMPRELQSAKNEELDRRLETLERKIDNVPRDTANQVMLLLRAQT